MGSPSVGSCPGMARAACMTRSASVVRARQ
jgi:hypothetical protein